MKKKKMQRLSMTAELVFNTFLPRLSVVLVPIVTIFAEASTPDCMLLRSFNWQHAHPSWNSSNTSVTCCTWSGVVCDPTGLVVLHLALPRRNLGGPLPSGLGRLSFLQSLDLSFNDLDGVLGHDWQMPYMGSLILSNNRIGGPLPPSWGESMPNMLQLDLSYNLLTGGPPASWGRWANLRRFTLSYNKLSSTLPNEYSSLAKLQYLDFTYNRLTGTLPSSWGAWFTMGYMSLSGNMLEGTLPPSWGAMKFIQFLGIESNKIVGAIPHEWCNFSSPFVPVNLGSNLLDVIPVEIFDDPSCKLGLMLAENKYSGALPARIVAPSVCHPYLHCVARAGGRFLRGPRSPSARRSAGRKPEKMQDHQQKG
jgi:hypothetical protein